jgi:hypothetical protein
VAGLLKAAIGKRSTRQIQNLTGVPKSTVHNLLSGKGTSTARTLEDMAVGLGIDPAPLLKAANLEPSNRVTTSAMSVWGLQIPAKPLVLAFRGLQTIGVSGRNMDDVDLPDTDFLFRLRAWRIVGDLLSPALVEGDEILVSPGEFAVDGSGVIAVVDLSTVVCRRLRVQGARAWLEPVEGEDRIERDRFEIIGVIYRVLRAPASIFPERRSS